MSEHSAENDAPRTRWFVYCDTHRHYLKHASSGGTTWRDEQAEARIYDDQTSANLAATTASWLDHTPMVWPIPPGSPWPRPGGSDA